MVAAEMKNCNNISENLYSGVFGVADYEYVIRFSKFKMADSRWRPPKSKTAIILVKIYIQRFLVSLIMNPSSDFPNSGWRIQVGSRRNEKLR